MKVLGLSSFPIEAAATRFRLAQFVTPLKDYGIELTLSSFLNSEQFREFYTSGGILGKAFGMLSPLLRRAIEASHARDHDVILVQREAMFFGPAVFESLYGSIAKRPLILDLDDATYVSYRSPTYGRLGSFFKFFGKTDRLISQADLVICGNRFIAEYVENKGSKAVIIPTIVDTDEFCPVERHDDVPVIGWVGTHSTFPFLQYLFPILEKLAAKHEFVLKIVGAGTEDIGIPGVKIVNEKWDLNREIADFQSLDIGLYPITVSDSANMQWLQGKSGFKAIQYLAVGVPFVMSPVGVCAEIGEPDSTHFNAVTEDDWYCALDKLLTDEELRRRMGERGRAYSVQHYNVPMHAKTLAEALASISFD
jgi:glycosyltransferase involved in cell wall biosynthesis